MLIEFTVGNFKSFRDKTTFSMIAANMTSEDPALDTNNVIPISKNLSLLKSAAVYGANASGKSNLGAALRFMREFVLKSASEAISPEEVGLEPFRLDRKVHELPSFFEVILLLDHRQYRYGFEVNTAQIVSEWLFHVPKTKEVPLFVRDEQRFDVRAGFKEGKSIELRTRRNALFLSVTALFNGTVAQRVQNWFANFAVETGLQDDRFRELTLKDLLSPEKKDALLNFINGLGLDVDGVMTTKPRNPETISHSRTEEVLMELSQMIFIRHRFGEAPGDVEFFNLDTHESQGTRKLIAMSGPLQDILQSGQVMFVDELDARLHPLMTRRIIELFHSPLTNPNGAQLIFATHDTNLLDKTLFRRDQIWFAEKDRQGATHLASLAEFRVRSDAAFEKQYLEGRYGAIPFLGDLSRLPWAQNREEADAAEREPVHA